MAISLRTHPLASSDCRAPHDARPVTSRRMLARFGILAGGTLAVLASAVATLTPCTARAQGRTPTQGAPPNVLLLVDTSGSMERMPNGAMPVCTPGVAGQDPNRWGSIVQGLTGSMQPFYSCGRMHRDGTAPNTQDMSRTAFRNAYWDNNLHGSISPQAEYDDGYAIPHHRPLSGSEADSDTCGLFPDGSMGLLPAFGSRTFNPNRLATYPWRSGNYNFPNGHSNPWANPDLNPNGQRCAFRQGDDGQLDNAARYARFGLMTFDSDTNPGTGNFLDFGGLPSIGPFLGSLIPGLNLNLGGQWTFLYSNSDPFARIAGLSQTNSSIFPLVGRVPGCTNDIPMSVGARNEHAPSWEGPFMPFPIYNSTVDNLVLSNTNVQSAIIAARPYGGTPIAGMMASAYDYMLRWNSGNGHPQAPMEDPYVQGGCRDQYVVLLTDGGPNLDLRTQELCSQGQAFADEGTTINPAAPYCPFYLPKRTANRLRAVPGAMRPITTFVVGFAVGHDTTSSPSVANDGFPGGVAPATCAEWRRSVTTANDFAAACTGRRTDVMAATGGSLAAWESTTARACCELNDIALAGSDPANPQGAFFAETEGDLNGVFAAILGNIAQQSATRAVPAYSSATVVGTGPTAVTQASTFVASFQADPSRTSAGQNGTGSSNIWSGQIQRTRQICTGGATTEQTISQVNGDDVVYNFQQNLDRNRFFFTAVPAKVGGRIDGDESIRPYGAGLNDGVVQIGGAEALLTKAAVANSTTFRNALQGSSDGEIEDLFEVTDKTCKATTLPGGTRLRKVTNKTDCARILWGFATAATPADLPDASYGVNGAYAVRCPIGGGQGQTGNLSACHALGAIIHSSPTISGAPVSLLRDEGYRKYSDLFAYRRQTMYVASTDGLLHAFDANYPGRGTSTTTGELWAFIPPGVLGELQTNFPGGQRTLLDGSPVVKDVVYERAGGQVGSDAPWHTALVAGLGRDGYFALDVSADGQLAAPTSYTAVTNGNRATLNGLLRPPTPARPAGPHFLWQLTSTEANGSAEKGKKHKKGKKNKGGTDLYALFGDRVGTPAITTLFINDPSDPTSDGLPHEIGVAILPGGIDDPVPGPAPPSCPRRAPTVTYTGAESVMNPRSTVRGWGPACDSPVGGRSVTIVRLDNGRIIRHFARALTTDDDVPRRLLGSGNTSVCTGTGACRVINSPLDAPVTGTPVVFPNDPGAIAQKMFVGDADGTLYRFDLSNPNPSLWKAELFLDTRGSSFPNSDFVGDKPISVPPVVALGEKGSLVITVANGDQEDLGAKPLGDRHLLWSVTELPGTGSGTAARPQLNWYYRFDGGERVTGPMAVFDRALYFSTYRVNNTTNVCLDGFARIYGIDYVKPQNSGNLAEGGAYRIPNLPSNLQFTDEGPDLVPGVSVRASQACAQAQSTQDYFGGTRVGAMLTTPTSYSLLANRSKTATTPGNAVQQITKNLALPRTQTIIDSWASVVE